MRGRIRLVAWVWDVIGIDGWISWWLEWTFICERRMEKRRSAYGGRIDDAALTCELARYMGCLFLGAGWVATQLENLMPFFLNFDFVI